MLSGTYVYDARVNISNCGSREKLITLRCDDGRAVLDFSAMPYHKHADNLRDANLRVFANSVSRATSKMIALTFYFE